MASPARRRLLPRAPFGARKAVADGPLSLRRYRSTAKVRRGSRRLVVAMSQNHKPLLGRLDYGTHYVSVWEWRGTTYYVRQAGTCVAQLGDWITAHDVREVCFFGLSKGGFGSLLWGSLLARARPDLAVSSLAFSPQTLVWPVNRNIVFPSYLGMIDKANAAEPDRHLVAGLKAYGTLADASDLPNYYARIVYPARRERDVREADKIRWANVEKDPLDLSIHNTLLPHIVDLSDEQAVHQAVSRLLGMKGDADVRSSTQDTRVAEMVAEYRALPPRPPLTQLLQDVMDTNIRRNASAS